MKYNNLNFVMISVADRRAGIKKEFDNIDTDHNGFITQDELYTYLDRKVVFYRNP